LRFELFFCRRRRMKRSSTFLVLLYLFLPFVGVPGAPNVRYVDEDEGEKLYGRTEQEEEDGDDISPSHPAQEDAGRLRTEVEELLEDCEEPRLEERLDINSTDRTCRRSDEGSDGCLSFIRTK